MKRHLLLFIVTTALITSCNKSTENTNPSGDNNKIGDSAYGGTIVYIDSTGKHGLVCAFTDQDTAAAWDASSYINGTYMPKTTGAVGIEIGTGAANTTQIISVLGNKAEAASICRNYRGGGYTDWFLPSGKELNLLYINRTVVRGLALKYYWSSSEGFSFAFLQDVALSPIILSGYKNGKGNIRAMRAF